MCEGTGLLSTLWGLKFSKATSVKPASENAWHSVLTYLGTTIFGYQYIFISLMVNNNFAIIT
jgi:hypothetical protein